MAFFAEKLGCGSENRNLHDIRILRVWCRGGLSACLGFGKIGIVISAISAILRFGGEVIVIFAIFAFLGFGGEGIVISAISAFRGWWRGN